MVTQKLVPHCNYQAWNWERASNRGCTVRGFCRARRERQTLGKGATHKVDKGKRIIKWWGRASIRNIVVAQLYERGAVRIVLRNKIAISKSNKEDNLGHDECNSARYMDMWVQV